MIVPACFVVGCIYPRFAIDGLAFSLARSLTGAQPCTHRGRSDPLRRRLRLGANVGYRKYPVCDRAPLLICPMGSGRGIATSRERDLRRRFEDLGYPDRMLEDPAALCHGSKKM